jgi:hypothetical protein
VGNNKNPNQKQPGEKEPGTFHYNPGNMSGKTGTVKKSQPEPRSISENVHEHPGPQEKDK